MVLGHVQRSGLASDPSAVMLYIERLSIVPKQLSGLYFEQITNYHVTRTYSLFPRRRQRHWRVQQPWPRQTRSSCVYYVLLPYTENTQMSANRIYIRESSLTIFPVSPASEVVRQRICTIWMLTVRSAILERLKVRLETFEWVRGWIKCREV